MVWIVGVDVNKLCSLAKMALGVLWELGRYPNSLIRERVVGFYGCHGRFGRLIGRILPATIAHSEVQMAALRSCLAGSGTMFGPTRF